MIVITISNLDGVVGIVKRQSKIDPVFASEIKSLSAWKAIDDNEILDAQTFVCWVRQQKYYKDKSLRDCLENDQYEWSSGTEVEE